MSREYPKLLIADKKGEIYDVPHLEATGSKGMEYFRQKPAELTKLHPDSELFFLPARNPVGYDPNLREYVELKNNPFKKNESCFAVAAFMAPGYTSTYSASYVQRKGARLLPLFSYSAVSFYKGEFYAAGVRIDREKRQELKGMDMRIVQKNVKLFKKLFPKNRLIGQLETCALTYGCPAGRNFFLKKYEGPLPTSPKCNARCIGCISYQPGKSCSVTQPRVTFTPTPEEIAETALFHIHNVKDPVVSFGQGCEGEPLMVGSVLEKAVKLIRKSTSKGIINLNTNASKSDIVSRIFDAGLDSMRVSINSVREKYYSAYYKPQGYSFGDVLKSIKNAKRRDKFVSINYLVMPGFTDSQKESQALLSFLEKTKVDMVQWRNMNYDPQAYFKKLKISVKPEDMIGMDKLIKVVKSKHPRLMHGYFNPSKGRMRRTQVI